MRAFRRREAVWPGQSTAPPQGQLRQRRLEPAQPREEAREHEAEIGPQHFEPTGGEQPARFDRREGDRVTVERDPAHDQSRPGVPGVVLPEGEQPARAQRAPDRGDGVVALGERDVVEHAVAIREVGAERQASRSEATNWTRSEPKCARRASRAGALRNVRAEQAVVAGQAEEVRGRGTRAAPEVEHRVGTAIAQLRESPPEPRDPLSSRSSVESSPESPTPRWSASSYRSA